MAVGYFFLSTSLLAVPCKCAAGQQPSTAAPVLALWQPMGWAGPVVVHPLDLAGRAH